ncbi:hypothetical protein [Flavobacterium pectinovorum]|uniref:hypothetical protein n=1 Tax=Flavobacterium pectinovorum TaxID=29533 RepID=UPI001FAC7D73|nr:hypothetical protein [Flavobacterium pectinovorum]MCI9843378.1 hypothetical protein [Flavobacterium pectinovorum]
MTSCDTEYNTTYVSGDADIKSFTVQEFEDQQPIQAAIVNDTIKILWVSYHDMPETITPTIVLSDKAAISPKAAVEIPFKTGEKYTVTSEAGTTKQYTLEVDFRQPQPKTAIFSTGGTIGGSSAFVYSIAGSSIDNLWFNLEQTRVYLVSAADKTTEYDCDIAYFGDGKGSNPFMNTGLYYYLPTNVPVGKYDLRIKNGEYIVRSATEANWFNFTITEPTTTAISTYIYGSTATIGGNFNIRGTKLDTLKDFFISIGSAGTRYQLEVVSRTDYSVTLKVPVGTPAGNYTSVIALKEDATQVSRSTLIIVKE